MKQDNDPTEHPLPGTVGFVTFLGAVLVVGWVLMFWLLVKRW